MPMTCRRCRLIAIFLAIFLAIFPVLVPAQSSQERPYVVLLSLDGFRYDYAQRDHAQNLLEMARTGASAQAMIPSFPSLTFPNHISIVTGLYPGHHGIVANAFYDPARKADYSLSRTATDGTWYQADPIWVTAEQQHVRTATMFWPTSDAEIHGVRPSYWALYDGKVPDEERIRRVLDWLKLPAAERPHLITLYLSDADDNGHKYGPDSAELKAAVAQLDDSLGQLRQGLQATGLPIYLIVVSDHGMLETKGVVNLSDYCDLSRVHVVNAAAISFIYAPDPVMREQVYGCLKGNTTALSKDNPAFKREQGGQAAPKAFSVYRRQQTPRRWHYTDPRIGDILVVANQPVELTTAPRATPADKGRHGYDPAMFPQMRAIFYATGPNIRQGVTMKPFENVNLYPFIARILGLAIPKGLDGSPKVLNRIFVNR